VERGGVSFQILVSICKPLYDFLCHGLFTAFLSVKVTSVAAF
jgi:hypothetical protein